MIRIAVVGDHKLASTGITALLGREDGFTTSGPFSFDDWRDALSENPPDVVLLVSRRRGAVTNQLARLREALPEARTVFVSLVDDDEALLSALQAGVEGALDINADAAFLVGALRDVMRGEIVISRPVARRLVGEYSALASGSAPSTNHRRVLTPREIGILRLIAEGESNKAIARQLSISEHTVRAHARSIMRKLEVANRVQAAAVALRTGLAAS